jgi:hypothetical protein
MGRDVPGLDFGEAALQGDHESSSMSFSPDALPASQVKGHTVDYNTYEELHISWDYFGRDHSER